MRFLSPSAEFSNQDGNRIAGISTDMLGPTSPTTSMRRGADSIGDFEPSCTTQNQGRPKLSEEVSTYQPGLASPVKLERVYTLDPLADSRWDELVAFHPRASVFHNRGWLESLARTYGYRPLVFTTSPPNSALRNGLLFCQVASWLTGRRLVSLPFSDHCEPICDSPEEMDGLTDGCRAELAARNWRYLEVRPTHLDVANAWSEAGFRPVGQYFLHVVDLRQRPEKLFQSFDKDSVQRRIQRAERAGLVEKCGTSPELLAQFYRLFVMTRGRHNLPPPPYKWFENLIECQGTGLEIRVACKDGTPIAAILTLRFRDTAYFKYGCSDARFNRFGATPWLLWRAIAAAKANGALTFDLGRTQESNAGLLAFKNNWAPNRQRLIYWRFPGGPSLDSPSGWTLRAAKRVFSFMPNRVLAVSGKLIYRHIG